ncbi:DUF4198 domain-containing protein [Pseudomonas sp. NPDC007930]|uniref:DUF4198 domain-containing protein n=1 Tax=Pseudomonas sp. NPDC007930 TaxID=3364417 RepID=UPI0036E333D9
MNSTPLRLLAVATLPLLIAAQASAHGLWTEQRRGHVEVVFGEGAEDDAFNPAQVKAAQAYGADGKPLTIAIERLDNHARLLPASGAAVVAVELDAGVWTKNAAGEWAEKPKAEVKDAVQAIKGVKYSVAVHDHYQALPAFDQLGLVIVPQADPTRVGTGKPLKVKVLHNGKPMADVKVYGDYRGMPSQASATTDANGVAEITVRNEGLNVVAAYASVPVKGDKAVDELGYFTSLTFVGEEHQE